ncbi:C39 family peptidase [Roseomonas sp. HF4]|uniref:C39 family peptidase n=1 Tax=Roseomonas sp. HF4 TaxID=2562313 RepID=UPI0010C008FE|nr:C39 family peptidase [Roseomonas sp. HF4]
MRRALTPILLSALLAACAADGTEGTRAPPAPGAAAMPVPDFDTGGPSLLVPVRDIRSRRFARTIRQRFDYSCGSAALATLLTHHYRLPTTEEAVLQDMVAEGDAERIRTLGFSLLDMQRYLARRGIRSNGYRMPLERFAEVGVPAIVLIDNNGYRHFVVLRGITGDRVLIGDPNLGTRTMPRVRFEESWNGVLFVILDRPDLGRAGYSLAEDWGIRSRAPGVLVRDQMDRTLVGLGMPAPLVLYSGVPDTRGFLPQRFF